MSHPNITFCGDDALRIEAPDQSTRLARARQLQDSGEWIEVVPGRRDITVQFDLQTDTPQSAQNRLSLAVSKPLLSEAHSMQEVRLPVHFGGESGPDLGGIAHSLDLSESDLIAQLTAKPLDVDMLGFTPGFAYMSGLSEELEIPRLSQPRQQVPAGSIGLISGQCGLYALAGPGGWPLIGRTDVSLFEPSADNPFRLQPGMQVQLVDADAS
ncbi:5-oxoprolinase subunit PxpB [Hyphomonas oceanitis]|uniref:Allophanate hydrolase subunit 1 n=1 Tax=Hyphomonas oceanitis SCH89 TaxID=1280953 RepID=A0A059G5G2_9PROT|nr:5-oxoprolinase subunit PxpB [Hyphomonas oceanitis]KDA02056.1 allophanate hydrolase subunit 1 [Hyphomonas oceanitis SCH89]